MARLVTEGFEFGGLGTATDSTGATAVSTDKYTGTYSAQTTANTGYLEFPITGRSGYVKLSYKMSYATATNYCIFTTRSSTTQQFGLVVSGTTGLITARRGTTSLTPASSSGLYLGQWNNVECYFVQHGTTGAVTVKVNGKVVLELTDQNTQAADSDLTNIRFGYGGSFSYYGAFGYYDDIFVNDTTGGADDTWLGDRRLAVVVPDGAGYTTNLTPSSGSTNWDLVNEIPHDGDGTYVWGAEGGLADFYSLGNLPVQFAGATIHAVQPVSYAKTDVLDGTGQARVGIGISATPYWGGDQELTQAYQEYRGARYVENPSTSSAWTESAVNSLEVGFETVDAGEGIS